MKMHFLCVLCGKELSRLSSEIRMRGKRVILLACCGVAAAAFSTSPNDSVRYQGAVVGTVFDSLTMRPLAGAMVQLLLPGQTAVSTTSDSAGTFRFDELAAGRHFITFAHGMLDSLGIEFHARGIDVPGHDTVQVRLATPSARTIAHTLCPADREDPAIGSLLGFVRSAEDGAPLGPSTVWVRFDDYVVSRRHVQRDSMGRVALTQGNGYFVVCGIPAGVTVLARAATGADTSGYVELELSPNAFLKRDLFVGKMFRVTIPADSSLAPQRGTPRPGFQVLRGTGVLLGSIRRADGRPIPNARVSVWGTGHEVLSSDSGTFMLDSLPTGSHMVDVRALGFLPQRDIVDLREGVPTTAAFGMTAKQTFLDTVRVLASRAYVGGRIAEFEGRRRSRIGGYFMDQDEIDRRRAASFTDLMRGIPTVAIDPDTRYGDQVRMIGASNENDPYCDPSIWIDGMKQPQRENSLNAILFPERIVALEVYSRTVEAPAQFQSGSRCGVILVWTGERIRRQMAPEKR
jgi:hypothetical protein